MFLQGYLPGFLPEIFSERELRVSRRIFFREVLKISLKDLSVIYVIAFQQFLPEYVQKFFEEIVPKYYREFF